MTDPAVIQAVADSRLALLQGMPYQSRDIFDFGRVRIYNLDRLDNNKMLQKYFGQGRWQSLVET